MKENKYTETVSILNDMASVKMAMNAHKGEIEDVHPSKIIELLRREVDELETAIDHKKFIDVVEEAADVQNFLVALVHQQIIKYRSRPEKANDRNR
jgi:transcriptional/translational regulatory protein YebC/TACO1